MKIFFKGAILFIWLLFNCLGQTLLLNQNNKVLAEQDFDFFVSSDFDNSFDILTFQGENLEDLDKDLFVSVHTIIVQKHFAIKKNELSEYENHHFLHQIIPLLHSDLPPPCFI